MRILIWVFDVRLWTSTSSVKDEPRYFSPWEYTLLAPAIVIPCSLSKYWEWLPREFWLARASRVLFRRRAERTCRDCSPGWMKITKKSCNREDALARHRETRATQEAATGGSTVKSVFQQSRGLILLLLSALGSLAVLSPAPSPAASAGSRKRCLKNRIAPRSD